MTVKDRQLFMEMHGDIKQILSDNASFKKTLYGNGKPGVTDRLMRVETRQDDCQTSSTARRNAHDKRMTLRVAAASIVCSGLTSFAIYLLNRSG
jgi:hypothetical protein